MTQFLLELDGLKGLTPPVVVLGATNHLQALDAALIRPGRLDSLIHVALPDAKGREAIVWGKIQGMYIASEVTPSHWTIWTREQGPLEGWSGAELVGMLDWAGQRALTRAEALLDTDTECPIGYVGLEDVREAIERMSACRDPEGRAD